MEIVRSNIELDAFVVMPNHVHGIIVIWGSQERAMQASPLHAADHSRLVADSLGAIVGGYKSAVTRKINHLRATPGSVVWQRSYHDVIIRNEQMLNSLRQYIQTNPAQWAEDRYCAQ